MDGCCMPCLNPCCNCIKDPFVARHAAYIGYTNEKLKRADDEVKDLESKKADLERQINGAEDRGKKPTEEAIRMIERVTETKEYLRQTNEKFSQRRCFPGGQFLNCVSRYKTGRKESILAKDCERLKEEMDKLEKVATTPPPSLGRKMQSEPTTFGAEISSNLEKICALLKDDCTKTIGIWGMGGVGKTTLLKAINDEFLHLHTDNKSKRLFQNVIFVVVSKDFGLGEVQSRIAADLSLPKLQGDVDADANAIFDYLSNRSFLLLLDDIWKAIDLRSIGIPLHHLDDQDQLKQKFVFTTRLHNVCVEMNATITEKVNSLDKEEAWQMFKQMVGETILSNRRIETLAKEVAEECGGLPLALKVIGRAMSIKNSPKAWQHALSTLRSAKGSIDNEDKVFRTLKISYDNLPDKKYQECFLCCALWPEDYEITTEYLIQCWIGKGLIDGFQNIIEAYNHGFSITDNLANACLIESHKDFFGNRIVKVHDVIRNMAIWLASKCGEEERRWIIEHHMFDKETLTVDIGKDAECVSIWFGGNLELKVSIDCSRLTLLVLHGGLSSKIFEGFFKRMPSLKYLEVESIQQIDNLEAFFKGICDLSELEYLSLDLDNFNVLNIDGQLKKLKYFYYHGKASLSHEQLDAIVGLPMLQVLDVFPVTEIRRVHLEQLKERNLKALSMRVGSIETLERLNFFNMDGLNIVKLDGLKSIQMKQLGRDMGRCLQYLEIHGCDQLEELIVDGSHTLDNIGILLLECLPNFEWVRWTGAVPSQSRLESLHSLYIIQCHKLKDITWVINLPCLAMLYLESCDNLQEVVSGEKSEFEGESELQDSTFKSLEGLILRGCPRLRSVYPRPVPFPRLELIEIRDCPELKKFLTDQQMANNSKLTINRFVFVLHGNNRWGDLTHNYSRYLF